MRTFLPLLAGLALPGYLSAAGFAEDFSSDPAARGWQSHGHTDLFRWDPVAGHLAVTWDSSKPNSYFSRPLGMVLSKADDFQFSFDLELSQVVVGPNPDKPFTFEVAVGLNNWREATNSNFLRGTGAQSPNLVEFDYFGDTGFGATVSTVIVSGNGRVVPSFTFPLELTRDVRFRVEMSYTAVDQTLRTVMLRNGQQFGPIKDVKLEPAFTDFQVDTLAVSSYSDTGAGGSLLARGVVDNVAISLPQPPLGPIEGALHGGLWQVAFRGQTNWFYTLERTGDFKSWSAVTAAAPGQGALQTLQDDASPDLNQAFYRVRAEKH